MIQTKQGCPPMLNVALTMHSSHSPNLGVGALTEAQVVILRGVAKRLGTELQINILDWVGSRPPYVTGPDVTVHEMTGRTLIDPRGYFRYLLQNDLIIDIGAGDSFADIYGPSRLRRMMWMQYLAHLTGRPVVLAPQTYGPFTRPTSIRAARGTIRRAALVASRDAKSTAAVHDLAPDVTVIEASDVALRLPTTPPRQPVRTGDGAEVGLNISGLLMSGGYTRNNMFGLNMDYPGMIRTLVGRLLDHPDVARLHLVPHVIVGNRNNVEDDCAPALDLQKEFPQIVVAPAFDTPSEAKGYIAELDFFAGARMHACIAAFSSGVPVVPMAYSRKFAGLFGTLGYDHTVDCTTEVADVIVDRVMQGFEARAALAENIKPALAAGLDKLNVYETGLERIVAGLVAKKSGSGR